jgi:hypothetical protein
VFRENAADGVVVPAPRQDPDERGPSPSWRVRRVHFRGAADAGRDHVAPDPFLLTVKAAINWSRRHNQQLLAAAEPHDDDDEGLDEPELYALEEYVAWNARAIRPPEDRDELAERLGQSRANRADKSPAPTTSGPIVAPMLKE